MSKNETILYEIYKNLTLEFSEYFTWLELLFYFILESLIYVNHLFSIVGKPEKTEFIYPFFILY